MILPASAVSTIACRTGIVTAVGSEPERSRAGRQGALPARGRLRRPARRDRGQGAEALRADRPHSRLIRPGDRWELPVVRYPLATGRSGRVAEGGALLRRYGGELLHRGFESLLLRSQWSRRPFPPGRRGRAADAHADPGLKRTACGTSGHMTTIAAFLPGGHRSLACAAPLRMPLLSIMITEAAERGSAFAPRGGSQAECGHRALTVGPRPPPERRDAVWNHQALRNATNTLCTLRAPDRAGSETGIPRDRSPVPDRGVPRIGGGRGAPFVAGVVGSGACRSAPTTGPATGQS